MVQFVCTRCGKCCMGLGRHIRIQGSLSSAQHYCRVAVTGELVPVTVLPQFRDLFSSGEKESTWCPFLRKDPGGHFVCTVHESRPGICREFKCRSMVIYRHDGEEAGVVTGRRSLATQDPRLESAWRGVPKDLDDSAIAAILEKAGYHAVILE